MKRFFCGLLLLIGYQSYALESIVGKVTVLEPTYLPGNITFQMDTGNESCPVGTWLTWNKSSENNKLVFSTLMTALITQKNISFIINDGDNQCIGQYLHLAKD